MRAWGDAAPCGPLACALDCAALFAEPGAGAEGVSFVTAEAGVTTDAAGAAGGTVRTDAGAGGSGVEGAATLVAAGAGVVCGTTTGVGGLCG
jgi:hypothetical protein